jgi:acetylornithine deacetylase
LSGDRGSGSGARQGDPAGEAVALLLELVRTPSPSGQERAVAARLAAWARERGLEVSHDDAAVRLSVPGREEGPTLLFASHLDTVPPGEGWSVEPFAGIVRDGRLVARGASDAKASVASMAVAAADLARAGGPRRGCLVVLATCGEETRDTTMPAALERLGRAPDAAIIGEPTSLAPAIAQRGQLLLRLVWRGDQVHAGWAAGRTPPPVNAIERAARDLVRLPELRLERTHPRLGQVAVTPTMLGAGIARNVTPPRCEAVLDVRTTPAYTHAEVTAAVRDHLEAEVEVISERLVPAETPPGSRLLPVVEQACDGACPFASPTASDWVFLRHVDAVKLGPGDSRVSHTADEWVDLAEVERAAEVFRRIAEGYLS